MDSMMSDGLLRDMEKSVLFGQVAVGNETDMPGAI